jgi:hypothetical protein
LKKVDSLKSKPRFSLHNAYLYCGLFFFMIFILSVTQKDSLFGILSIMSFIISSTALIKSTADIFHYKKNDLFSLLLGVILLGIVGVAYYMLWNVVLLNYALLFIAILGVILLLLSGFFSLHAYMSYYYSKAQNEALITFGIISLTWLLLGVSILYQQVLLFLLLFILVLLSTKAVVDFSKRFVKN